MRRSLGEQSARCDERRTAAAERQCRDAYAMSHAAYQRELEALRRDSQ